MLQYIYETNKCIQHFLILLVGRSNFVQEQKLVLAVYMFNSLEELQAFPQPAVGVTPGYPTKGEQGVCLWSYCPGLCCVPELDYRLRPPDGLRPPGPPFIAGRSMVVTAIHGGYEEVSHADVYTGLDDGYPVQATVAVGVPVKSKFEIVKN